MRIMYIVLLTLLRPIVALLYPARCTGRENIPAGAAIVCPNHSNFIDPLLVAYAVGPKVFLRCMAKKELFKIPLLGWLLKVCGAFGVNRGETDINAIRAAVKILRENGKILIFPEGTRSGDDNTAAKTGAVRLAVRYGIPLVPVYLTRRKKVFSRAELVIGKPYIPEAGRHGEYSEAADRLMENIYALRPDTL